MAREESELQNPNQDAETLEMICTDCRQILFQPAALTTLFETGLSFQKALTRLRSISQTDCHVCALLRSVVLEGAFIGRQGDESYRFDVDVWGRSMCTFTLKAVVDHAKLIHEFIRFDIYFMELGPVAFWGKSLELVIRPENRTPHLKFARRWLDDCMKFHADCKDLVETVLPTRVLEILQEDGTPDLKLRASNGAYGRYMALSYCWGQPQPAKLTTDNLHEYAQAIEESNLPTTIRDFIGIARALGVRFIWVDAYCILQDSDDDKHREIGNMGEIYKNSFLTIIASKARSVSDGFVNRGPCVWPSWNIPFQPPQGNKFVFTLQKIPHIHLDEQPISHRAWTLQERLLSPRTMSFFSGIPALEWRCESVHESNIGPIERLYRSDVHLYSSILPRCGAPTTTPAVHRLCHRWADIVHTYSIRVLSDPNDKLPAIGGIAKEFNTVLASTYYAGLWGKFLLTQLLWTSLGCPETPCCRASRYRAPSWSWASIDGPIALHPAPYPTTAPMLTILSCDVTLCDRSNPFGGVLAGTLTVKGLLKPALVRSNALFDAKTGQRLSYAYLDTQPPPVSVPTWCLPVTSGNSADWEVETTTSETSEDDPDSLCALLLAEVSIEGTKTFQRIGIAERFLQTSLQWFEGVIEEVIHII
jgi:hypothetical protein